MFHRSYLDDSGTAAADTRPNSLAPARCDTPEASPQPQPRGSWDHYPMLLSTKLHGHEFSLTLLSVERTYTIHDHAEGRVSRLAPGTLIYVRVSRATPDHAEVFEPSTVCHRFLGHAIARKTPGLSRNF